MNKREMKTGVLGYIPGFRTGVKWKMVISSIYYLFSLLCLCGGLWFFLLTVSLPFFIMNIATALRRRNRLYLIPSAIALVALVVSVVITPPSNSVDDAVPTATPLITAMPTDSVEPTSVPTEEPTTPPTLAPTPAPTPTHFVVETSPETIGVTVWIGETGTKYHHQDCRTLKGNKYEITLDEAKAQGRTPCGVCYK